MDLPVFVAGKASVEEARKALEEGVAYYLAHLEVEERPFPRPGATPPPDLEEERDRLIPVEIRPSPVNPVSLAIEKALSGSDIGSSTDAETGEMMILANQLAKRAARAFDTVESRAGVVANDMATVPEEK